MRTRSFALWSAPIAVGMTVAALLFSVDARDAAMALLGDEAHNDLVALSSGFTARPTNTADAVAVAHTDVNPYGINVFLEQEVEEWKVRRTLEMVRDAGFHWVKQQVLWYDIETPAKGQYFDAKNNVADTWQKYDRIVNLAREYGLELILRLDTSPDWARPGNSKQETPPDRFEDYGDFVHSVVARYRGKVKYYQIWNEPNLAFEWGGHQPDAKEYVRLLRIGYTRAKEADPESVVIAAALSPTLEMSAQATNDLVFLQQMYDAGARQWFDIMGVNAYGLRNGPDDRRLDDAKDVNFSRPILIRELMVRNGDAAKPVWASETGWNALPPDFPGDPPWGRVTREQQAQYTVRAYQRMREEWPWMGVAALWHFRMVHDVNQVTPQYYFGIVQNDFQPYPVYDAMKKLATAEPLLEPGFRQESDWAVRHDGAWRSRSDERASLGAFMLSETAGSTLSFAFEGADLDLVVGRSSRSGRLLISVDGGPYGANRLPRDAAGQACADLWSAQEQWQQRLTVARGLPWGVHHVEMRLVAGPEGYTGAAVDGFVVGPRPPGARRRLAVAALPLLAIAGFYAFFRLATRDQGDRS